MESFEGSRVVREDRSVNKKMKELRTAIEINASAETVWAILTDLSPFAACCRHATWSWVESSEENQPILS